MPPRLLPPQVSERLGAWRGGSNCRRWSVRNWSSRACPRAREVVALSDAMGLRDQFMRVLGLARSTVERKIAQRGPLSQPEATGRRRAPDRPGRRHGARGRQRPTSTPRAGSPAGWPTRCRALGGMAQELLDTADGREAVSTLLYQMKSGAYA